MNINGLLKEKKPVNILRMKVTTSIILQNIDMLISIAVITWKSEKKFRLSHSTGHCGRFVAPNEWPE